MEMRKNWKKDRKWLEDIDADNTDPRSRDFMGWLAFDGKVKKFGNVASIQLFSYLFDPLNENVEKRESSRLWRNFCGPCQSRFREFLTYLSQDQKDTLLYNLDQNEYMFNYSKGW